MDQHMGGGKLNIIKLTNGPQPLWQVCNMLIQSKNCLKELDIIINLEGADPTWFLERPV